MVKVVVAAGRRGNSRWMYALALLPMLCVWGTASPLTPRAIAVGLAGGLAVGLTLVRMRFQVARAQRKAEQARARSETDPLTGLKNRRGLLSSIDVALRAASRRLGPASVVFLDLDGFKQVNDRLGHDTGDALLEAMAEVLNANCRAGADEPFRLGGDEFVIVCRGTDARGAARLADRVRSALRSHRLVASLGVAVDVSAGVATARWVLPPELLLARADEAMLRAKAAGKGRTMTDQDEEPTPTPLRLSKPAA